MSAKDSQKIDYWQKKRTESIPSQKEEEEVKEEAVVVVTIWSGLVSLAPLIYHRLSLTRPIQPMSTNADDVVLKPKEI